MSARQDYFDDLLEDAYAAIDARGDAPNDEAAAVLAAALILSDGLNGLRKAVLAAIPRHASRD